VRILIEALGPPLEEPLTVWQLEALVRLEPLGSESTVWPGYISAARQQVEHDTERILIATPCLVTVAYDDEPWSTPEAPQWRRVPLVSRVQAVRTATARTRVGAAYPLPAWSFRHQGGALTIAAPAATTDRIEFEVVLGWEDAATLASLAPGLIQAVGVLAVHFVTHGRDLVAMDGAPVEMPFAYRAAIQPWRVESIA